MYNDIHEQIVIDKTTTRTASAIYAAYGKRAFDIGFSLLLVPFALVVIGFVAAAMVITGDRGHLFFGHRRVGKHGKAFKCWKIRTMAMDAEHALAKHIKNNPETAAEWGLHQKLTNDPRITPLGRFLRRTSLDEFPQLWNVFCGEMSLVGPRPVIRSELHRYGKHRSDYKLLRPGMTGLWQSCSGRNDISYNERVGMDMEYLSAQGFVTDLLILLKTARTVFMLTGK